MNVAARAARRLLRVADNVCASLSSGLLPKQGSLVTVVFHEIYADRAELSYPGLAPNQRITVEDLRRFLDLMLGRGYKPVSAAEVDEGLPPGGHYLLVTFDDGYFNNMRALDVLAQFHTPAIFFVSTAHALEQKAYWWDALARELRLRGASEPVVEAEIRRMKIWSHERIEESLKVQFGPDVLRPRSDLDRPMRPDELRELSRSRWAYIGNHTRDHAILPNCTREQIREQIEGCQRDLQAMTGRDSIAIAYPNGDYSRATVDIAREAGLRLGLTVRPCSNRLPLQDDKSLMTLGRFLVWGGEDFRLQCRKISANFIPGYMLKTLMMSAY